MKFPIKFPEQFCIPTKGLTDESYAIIIKNLKEDGYNWPTLFDDLYPEWEYLGVTCFGTIVLFNNSEHFIGIDDKVTGNNVLPKAWLNLYLKRGVMVE